MSSLNPNSVTATSADGAFKQLFKLEAECRSPVLATQVQAVGQFPKLFDQFPFPTLVGSAFLKLGDLFRSSTNSLRFHIAQVFEASNKHLPQITHTEELLKRVLAVLYSNDPIARVLALRLIGNGSIVFAKYPETQHGVLLRFQSTNPLEIAAAVQTTQSMLRYSPGFLTVVWETVITKAGDTHMLDSARTQLIRSLKHAAPNLQLSVVLYDHCRTWMSHPESSIVVQNATMATWKAIIQQHNTLRLEDAAFVSCYIQHELASTRRAALALLYKWNPADQSSDISVEDEVDTIRDRLVSFVRQEYGKVAGSTDIYCIRLALAVLARIEAQGGYPGTPECWELAEAYSSWALQICCGLVSKQASVLDFMQTELSKSAMDSDQSDDSSTRVKVRDSVGLSDRLDGQYRQLVSGTLLATGIAKILNQKDYIQAASDIVARTWRVISGGYLRIDNGGYAKRFLKVTWRWCKQMGTAHTITKELEGMLDSPNECIQQVIVSISSSGEAGDQLLSACQQNIANLAGGSDIAGREQRKIWVSMAAALAYELNCGKDSGNSTAESAIQLATDAISRWHAHLCNAPDGSQQRAMMYARSGPPAHLFQKLVSLFMANGSWANVGILCKSVPAHLLSDRVQTWIRALTSLADSETSLKDVDTYLRLADSSLTVLRSLDNQGVPRRYQIYIVQLRRESVQVFDSWQRFSPSTPVHPSLIQVAKSLVDRTQELSDQAGFILWSFAAIDPATRGWLAWVQTISVSIVDAVSAIASTEGIKITNVIAISGAVHALIQPPLSRFCLGPPFLSIPPSPRVSVETRPNMDSGDGSSVTVFSGSQFHLIVEGFLQLPEHSCLAKPARIHIATWLSQQPRQSSYQDLVMSSRELKTARGARRATQGGRSGGYVSTTTANKEDIWDRAIAFEAALDGLYFECPCVIPIPHLQLLFGNYDTNIMTHVHIYCGLVDSENQILWIGPYKSYPLIISTTARS
ncbi:hypothetical protein GGI15_001977 [Coemansia interrupta]|uniref:Integrator complex subunit 7 N-terminal domain-containing protein n=1 Tax=Coemansia interrupta TaxID=1126814 RepID=A0A9W8HNY5_9FUNG|nr:hypothetical protein GGI15_001977 [Coemansia interrupta]